MYSVLSIPRRGNRKGWRLFQFENAFLHGRYIIRYDVMFTNTGMRRMLKGRDFPMLHMMFSFTAGFINIDGVTGRVGRAPMPRLHTT